MLVRATMEGFYGNERKMPGKVFNMDAKFMKKDREGKSVLPSWVESADKVPAKGAARPSAQEPSDGKESQVI